MYQLNAWLCFSKPVEHYSCKPETACFDLVWSSAALFQLYNPHILPLDYLHPLSSAGSCQTVISFDVFLNIWSGSAVPYIFIWIAFHVLCFS